MGQTEKKQKFPPFLYEKVVNSALVNLLKEFTSTIVYKKAEFAIKMQINDQSPLYNAWITWITWIKYQEIVNFMLARLTS